MDHSLLLIIDLQTGWRHNTATEAAMMRTVALCQRFGGDAIHCCFKNDPRSLFQKQLNWSRFRDTHDTEEIPEIVPFKLPRYWRTTYSCLTDELLPVVQRYDHVYIAGVFTDISVAMTAMDLFDHGVVTSIITDCVATLHGQPVHEAALRSLEMALGDAYLITSRQLLALQK